MTGDFHKFGTFISGVAALQRIVTAHDVKIKPAGGDKVGKLVMETTAKTYRYMDEEEEAARNAQAHAQAIR